MTLNPIGLGLYLSQNIHLLLRRRLMMTMNLPNNQIFPLMEKMAIYRMPIRNCKETATFQIQKNFSASHSFQEPSSPLKCSNLPLFRELHILGGPTYGASDMVPLHRIPGRLFLNGSSVVASLFTQQGKKGTNQDAMLVWENFA